MSNDIWKLESFSHPDFNMARVVITNGKRHIKKFYKSSHCLFKFLYRHGLMSEWAPISLICFHDDISEVNTGFMTIKG